MPRYRMPSVPPETHPDAEGDAPPPLPPNYRRGGGTPGAPRKPPGLVPSIIAVVLIAIAVYGIYLWFFVRVVVPPGKVLVLLKKDGSQSLPGNQIVIPAAPDPKNASAYAEWEKQYGDTNGILENVYLPGTYFSFSPFDYERFVQKVVIVPNDKVGVVVRRFGTPLDPGQVLADPARGQCGVLPGVLPPGTYTEYSNTYAYEVKLAPQVTVPPGHRGVVTIMAGRPTTRPNEYLVSEGEQGVQPIAENEGLLFANPYEKRIMPISVQSQRFEMTGPEAIKFPSADSFEIRMEGYVEWRLNAQTLPLIYVQYGEGGELIERMKKRVILPYSRSFSRLVGSQFTARDFISGDTRLKFQQEFETRLREACEKEGVQILQATVRDIIPPDDIKNPINEREIAKQQINSLEQQIQVARSAADLATQTEMANQNSKIGDANKQVVTITKKAQQDADVAITLAEQELAVAKLRLEAAQKLADALIAQGKADAAVILLNKEAEAKPLQQQVAAFGSGEAYAQYFFYQKVSPAIKSILTNTDGPFANLFNDFMTTKTGPSRALTAPAVNPASSQGANPGKVSNVQE